MKKYNINTILLGIIAISLTFLVLHKIYEEIMIKKMTNEMNEKLNKLNTAQDNLYKEEYKALENIQNMTGKFKNTKNSFEETKNKLETIPQIKMPKIEQTENNKEELKPHESSERKKVYIEVK